ncbi:MAG: hypothetical protein JNL82_29920 [Myxococcales bacterium]|nr:hypothetical protein [Myxococcales bacterium]
MPDGFDPELPAQIYPLATFARVIARSKTKLTPGYAVAARAVFLPSGPTQRFVLGEWKAGSSNAKLRIDVLFDNGVTTSTDSRTFEPKFSVEQYKALPPGAGAAWGVLETLEEVPISPGGIGWTEGVEVTITITAIGGARPVDVVVYEQPATAFHDETRREGTISNCPSTVAYPHPLTAVGQPDDPTRGSQAANKATADQRGVWGPAILHWSCWNEDTALVTASEGAAVSITQTSFRDLQSTAIASFGAGNPGWSASSGAYGRTLEQSGLLELRDVNGCSPVLVRAYARVLKNADVGTIRFQAEAYSYRDLTVTGSTTFGWYAGLAWLRVPVHASLDSLVQVLCKVGGAGQALEVRYLSAEFGGHYTVTQ